MIERLPLAVPGLRHAFSTRHGGVSEGPFATLNLGYHVEDDPARVTENRRRFAAAAEYAAERLITAQQVHGARLAWVGEAECGRGALDWVSAVPGTDGLLVQEPGVPVAILVADCAAVLIADPVRRALALVHAGWRGALGRIASAAARELAQAGSRPQDLYVGISPTLCPACLEVSAEIGDEVAAELGDAAVDFTHEKPRLRIHAMLAADLASVGVFRITAHPDCTRCRNEKYFSHRGQNGRAGRLALAAWWE
ncbi:MAG: peptidoglycan editing factor PgeF [Armatimonadota bacterium]